MVSEDEAYVYENEKEESDKMEENELAEIMGVPHQHNVPNENNRNHKLKNDLHPDNDPKDSE